METHLLDWASLRLRWAHVVVAIAWHLHWFYWESYSTWLTGFALYTVVYLFNAGSFLVDKSVYDWSPAVASVAWLAFLAAFWVFYDALCRWVGERNGQVGGDAVVGALVFVFVAAASWLACQLYAGRAAFLPVGAMIATAMSANVCFWIIPGQRRVIAQMKAGRPVDPLHGQRAKQRSVHNTYFTLPVLVTMLSDHYGWLDQGAHNWLALLLMSAGALIRHSFVARHKARVQGRRVPWEYAAAGTALIAGLAAWLAPAPRPAAPPAPKHVSMAEVRAVLEQRCLVCHNAQVQQKNVALHTPELVGQHAQAIDQQAVVLRLTPMNNATRITDAERALIQRWFEAGAPAE